jgi:restriction system protein
MIMPEITRKRSGQLVQAVLRILRQHPEGMAARDVIAEVARQLPPTEFEQSEYPNNPGVRRFEKIVRFSTIAAVKAGWLVKRRGTWTGTDDGYSALDRITDPASLYRESIRLYRQWERSQPEQDDGIDIAASSDEEPGVTAPATLEESEEAAWREITQYLGEINPYDFQELVAALLRAMGYHVAWVSPPGPDQGLDVVASTDPLGVSGPLIKVQVKRHQGKVSVDGVRAFMALLGSSDIGIFVCTGGFTSDAESTARAQETRRITLLGAEQLVDLWIEHYEQLDQQDRGLLPLKPVWFLAPPD